jgi:hypothetical protein
MSRKPNDLTAYAVAGYAGEPNQHLLTPPAHWAWALGAHFKETGRGEPREVRMGREDSIRAGDLLFRVGSSSVKFPTFERTA